MIYSERSFQTITHYFDNGLVNVVDSKVICPEIDLTTMKKFCLSVCLLSLLGALKAQVDTTSIALDEVVIRKTV
jgi:hypothetical protein